MPMIEIEVYARGLRAESMLMALHGQMDQYPQICYKVDTHHDLVYFEIDDGSRISLSQLTALFTDVGLMPRIVGQPPQGLLAQGSTQRLV
jgi:hypothetical protein